MTSLGLCATLVITVFTSVAAWRLAGAAGSGSPGGD